MPVVLSHVGIPAPPPPSAVLWRYTPFTKLLSLLLRQKLYLTNVSILRAEDPFEGTHSDESLRAMAEAMKGTMCARWILRPCQTSGSTIAQSSGTRAVDALIAPLGKFTRGLDLTPTVFSADKAGIIFKQSDGSIGMAQGLPTRLAPSGLPHHSEPPTMTLTAPLDG